MIEAYFDGATEPNNPGGHGALGFLVKVDGKVVAAEGRYMGKSPNMSNNVAEYAGVCCVLDYLIKYPSPGPIVIRGDSKLVINQLNGIWKVKGGYYKPFYENAKYLLDVLRERHAEACELSVHPITLEWIPREQNSECDQYSKQALTKMGVKLRIQPEKE